MEPLIESLDKHTRIQIRNGILNIYHDTKCTTSITLDDSEQVQKDINEYLGTKYDQMTNTFTQNDCKFVLFNLGKKHMILLPIIDGPNILYDETTSEPIGFQCILTDNTPHKIVFRSPPR